MPSDQQIESARAVFRARGGLMRTKQALVEGIHPRTLYAMRDAGLLDRLSRGLYRLAEAAPLGEPDLVAVALRAPNAVVCLVSALAHHGLTTQIPHAVYIALPTGAREPRLRQPPLAAFEFGGEAYTEGIQTHELDGIPVRIYGPEKTLADCFKYRNKLGTDVAVEALRLYSEAGQIDLDAIMRYARICRVATVMRPYLEAVL